MGGGAPPTGVNINIPFNEAPKQLSSPSVLTYELSIK